MLFFTIDTSIVGMNMEIKEGVRAVRSVITEKEERNNDAREDYFIYLINDFKITKIVVE